MQHMGLAHHLVLIKYFRGELSIDYFLFLLLKLLDWCILAIKLKIL